MAEGGVSLSSDLFKCSICLEDFKTPKLLPCFHTFCAHCLGDFIDKNSQGHTFYCPLCRASIDKPRNGVDEFQTNFYIEAAKELGHASDLPCDVCGPEFTAVQRCTDCEENICQKCTETHTKMKVLRHHKLMELLNIDPKRKRKLISKNFCVDHPSYELVFFCKKCEKRLCMVCKLSDHENHPTKDLASEAKVTRETLISLLNDRELKEKISRLKATIDNRIKVEKSLKTSKTEEVQEIREHAQSIHRVVDELAKEAEDRLEKKYQTDIQKIKKEIMTLQRDYRSACSTLDAVQLVLDHDGDNQIVENGKRLEKGIRDLKFQVRTMWSSAYQKAFAPTKFEKAIIASNFNISASPRIKLPKKKLCSNNFILVSKFQARITSDVVSSIAPVGRDIAWVCMWNGRSAWMVNSSGRVIRTVNIGPICRYATVNQNYEAIVSCPHDKSVRRITAENKSERLISNLDFYAHGLAYKKSLDGSMGILVSCNNDADCLRTRNRFHSHFGVNKGKTLLHTDDKIQAEIATETRVPINVDTDFETAKICIVDHDSSEVTIHDDSGNFLSSYSGLDFYPTDVCFYHSNCILLVNGGRDLRAIQADGTDPEILIKKNCYSVAVCEEMLWIGLNNGEIEIYDII